MSKIKLPKYKMINNSDNVKQDGTLLNPNKNKIHPSSLIAYLGQMGQPTKIQNIPGEQTLLDKVNAVPIIAYWDIYKNYYANRQEEIGAMIHTHNTITRIFGSVVLTKRQQNGMNQPAITLNTDQTYNLWSGQSSTFNNALVSLVFSPYNSSFLTEPNQALITFSLMANGNPGKLMTMNLQDFADTYFKGNYTIDRNPTNGNISFIITNPDTGNGAIQAFQFIRFGSSTGINPKLSIETFPLNHIDYLREEILASDKNAEFIVNDNRIMPDGLFQYPIDHILNEVIETWGQMVVQKGYTVSSFSQEGLALKTYQSDLFNNWINTEWLDNPENGINAITSIDTSSGEFSIDQLNLAKKVYDMLNRIAISGGTYKDWVETVYTHESFWMAETPIYEGGMSTEIVFQEVISSGSTNQTSDGTIQPLGTLAGRGRHTNHRGGDIFIKINEPSYIIGIVSITPRVDYSQGNRWWTNLDNMNDLHKPALDAIGFQDLITEQMVASDTAIYTDTIDMLGFGKKVFKSAGKQPAWINYMTNYNRTYGNFAIKNNQMFMTLNRLYSTGGYGEITDLTTYIEPDKFNYAFAQTDLEAMNFWVQIGFDISTRRIMSAKVIPNL